MIHFRFCPCPTLLHLTPFLFPPFSCPLSPLLSIPFHSLFSFSPPFPLLLIPSSPSLPFSFLFLPCLSLFLSQPLLDSMDKQRGGQEEERECNMNLFFLLTRANCKSESMILWWSQLFQWSILIQKQEIKDGTIQWGVNVLGENTSWDGLCLGLGHLWEILFNTNCTKTLELLAVFLPHYIVNPVPGAILQWCPG